VMKACLYVVGGGQILHANRGAQRIACILWYHSMHAIRNLAKLRDYNFSQQRAHSEDKQKSLCYVEVGFHGTDLEGASAITRPLLGAKVISLSISFSLVRAVFIARCCKHGVRSKEDTGLRAT
jgi:hypothetical protein